MAVDSADQHGHSAEGASGQEPEAPLALQNYQALAVATLALIVTCIVWSRLFVITAYAVGVAMLVYVALVGLAKYAAAEQTRRNAVRRFPVTRAIPTDARELLPALQTAALDAFAQSLAARWAQLGGTESAFASQCPAALRDAVSEVITLVVRDFVDSWYSDIGRVAGDAGLFEAQVTDRIYHGLRAVQTRVSVPRVLALLVDPIMRLATAHLKECRLALERVRQQQQQPREPAPLLAAATAADVRVARAYRFNGGLHPALRAVLSRPAESVTAAELDAAAIAHIRRVVERLLPLLVSRADAASDTFRLLAREIISSGLLGGALRVGSDPDTWNMLLEMLADSAMRDRALLGKLESRLVASVSSPAPATATAAIAAAAAAAVAVAPETESPDDVSSSETDKIGSGADALRLPSPPRGAPRPPARPFDQFMRELKSMSLWRLLQIRDTLASERARLADLQRQFDAAGDFARAAELRAQLKRLDAASGRVARRVSRAAAGHRLPVARLPPLGAVLTAPALLSLFTEFMARSRRWHLLKFWLDMDTFRRQYLLLESDAVLPHVRDAAQIADLFTFLVAVSDGYLAPSSDAYLLPVIGYPLVNAMETVCTFCRQVVDQVGDVRGPTSREQLGAVLGRVRFPTLAPFVMAHERVFEAMLELEYPQFLKSAAFAPRAVELLAAPEPAAADLPYAPLGPLFNAERRSDEPFSEPAAAPAQPGESAELAELAELVNSTENAYSQPAAPLPGRPSSLHSSSSPPPLAPALRWRRVVQRSRRGTLAVFRDDAGDGPPTPGETRLVRRSASRRSMGGASASASTASLTRSGTQRSVRRGASVRTSGTLAARVRETEQQLKTLASLLREHVARIADSRARGLPASDLAALAQAVNALRSRQLVLYERWHDAAIVSAGAALRPGAVQARISGVVERREHGEVFLEYLVHVTATSLRESWTIARRFSEFYALHQCVKGRVATNLELPARKLPGFHRLRKGFAEKRRAGLERYVGQLLASDAAVALPEVRLFLCGSQHFATACLPGSVHAAAPEPESPAVGSSVEPERRLRFPASGDDDEYAAVSPSSRSDDRAAAPSAARTATDAAVDMLIHVFDWKDRSQTSQFAKRRSATKGYWSWFRRQAVLTLLRQFLGSRIERRLLEYLAVLVSPAQVAWYLSLLTDLLWPRGGLSGRRRAFQRDRIPRTLAERADQYHAASSKLLAVVPELLGPLIGRSHARRGARTILDALQSPILNRQLLLLVFDAAVSGLFPDASGF